MFPAWSSFPRATAARRAADRRLGASDHRRPPRCAPSLARVRFQIIQGLRDMVERGYVVTATDYPGLGTPQTHPYLVGDSEGRAVLNLCGPLSVARREASSRFAVWGHSQGGQAALYTGLLARGYAPDLQLVGVAAAAPATDSPRL